MLNVKIILGSIREGRSGEKVGKIIHDLAKEEKDWNVEFLDLRDWELPLGLSATPPSTVVDGNYANPKVNEWAAKINEADAIIMITPEYNHGYSAALKNAIDQIYREWNRKPVAFVSYGNIAGGARVVEQLRAVAGELQMVSLRFAVHIPLIWAAFDEKGELKEKEHVLSSTQTMFADLTWWGSALKAARGQ